ncbi:MAG: PAS domain-containing sensor histidine kinase [Promethearchaeota archaeon]|nr:MAG: PAS domain-containing sensor histidine kinase [Candidatus Lokiarchaeota archaeon]
MKQKNTSKFDKEEIREKFKDLFEHSLDLIYVNDLKGNFLDANDIALKKLGYKREDIPSLSFIDLIDKEQLIKALETTKEIFDTGKNSERTEYKLKTKQDDFIYVNTYAIPLKKDGKIYAIFGVGTDITESKVAEQKLQDSEIKFRHLFESSPLMIVLMNVEGKIIDINKRGLDFTGYNKENLLNKDFRKLNYIIPLNYELLTIKKFKEVLKKGFIEPVEIQYYDKKGELKWIRVHASLVEVENAKFIQTIFQDITKEKQAEIMITKEIEKLKDLDQIRKDLISRVSHELKTPIMSIFGSSELLLEIFNDQLGKDALELVEIIDRGVKRLLILIENLLDTSKIEFNKIELDLERVNLSKIIKENMYDMIHFIKEREIEINLNLPENFPIFLDKIRIGQVITNLLSNAVKNSPPKGIITIDLQKIDNTANITVKDTGVGFTQTELTRIFTRFGKIERYGKGLEYIDIQGSGLGLYISKEIVELHGGEISAFSSGRNKGSIFTVKLPIK